MTYRGGPEGSPYRDRKEAAELHKQAVELATKAKNGEATADLLHDAIEWLTIAVMLWPDDYRMYCDLAEYLSLSGSNEKAVPYYERALKLKPDLLDERRKLIDTLVMLEQPDKALSCAEESIRIHPEDYILRACAGQCHYYMGRTEDAYLHMSYALELLNTKTQGDEDQALTADRQMIEGILGWLGRIVSAEKEQRAAQMDSAYRKNYPSNDCTG